MHQLRDLLARAANLSDLSDEELAQLDSDIAAAAEELAASGNLGDEELALLESAGEAAQSIRADGERREGEAAERQARAEAALLAIRGEQEGGGDGEGADGDTPDGSEGDEGEGEGSETTTTTTTTTTTPEEPEAEGEPPVEAIAAGAAPRRRAPLSRVAARRPPSAAPVTPTEPVGDLASMGLVASANAASVTAGTPIRDYDQLAEVFVAAVQASRAYRQGPPVKVPLVRAGRDNGGRYPEPFRLEGTDAIGNTEKLNRAYANVQRAGGVAQAITAGAGAATPEALVAAGGICAPQQVNYDLPTVGSTARPVRDQFMTRFGAERGGIRTFPVPVLDDPMYDGTAISTWTEANDTNPGSDGAATKPCATLTCPDEEETLVEAMVRCLEIGNFRARFFPEQIEAVMRLLAVEQARYAEQRLLASIATGSTGVTTPQVLGTFRHILAGLDRSIAVWQYRHRLDGGMVLNWAAPRWLLDQIRTDIARQLPVGTVEETLALADAEIERIFRTRNVNPIWLLDGESGQRFTVQGAGVLQGWPSTVKTYLAPAGAWNFLDGGVLDLGIVRDSTLNATNDFQMFAETFEGAHFHGVESWTITFDTCPDGSVSATVDIDPCSSGS